MFNLPPIHYNGILSGGMAPPSVNLRTIIHMNPRQISSQRRTPASHQIGAGLGPMTGVLRSGEGKCLRLSQESIV